MTKTENRIIQMKADAKKIFSAGLHAAGPANIISEICRIDGDHLWIEKYLFELTTLENIFVVGAGKATAVMAKAIEKIFGDRISSGIISVKYDHIEPLDYIQTIEAAHPLPDENGIKASKAIMKLVRNAGKNDLVICLISGGGSALLPLPTGTLTLKDKQDVTDLLLGCGANIHEINTLRKHLSDIKGGRLARAAAPAGMISLILSDVVGDDLDVIASGPGVPDNTTFEACMRIVQKYELKDRLPQNVLTLLEKGVAGQIDETPDATKGFFDQMDNIIIGSNRMALEACSQMAFKLGYTPWIFSSAIQGDTHANATTHVDIAKQILTMGKPIAPPACILSGGETTLVLKGDGLGGRNQESALVGALQIDNVCDVVMLCAGTDGTDGPTEAAGAFADSTTVDRAKAAGVNPQSALANNDSYSFFKILGDLLITGPTGTNVMDLNIVLIKK